MLSYKYYDTPEGHDVYKKVFVTSKYAALTGLAVSTFDVTLYSHTKGVFNTAFRFAYHVVPLVGMASAFTVTTNGLQNYRGKNDEYNYFFGGLVAGAVFGAWQKTAVGGLPMGILLGIAGVVKKIAIDSNYTFFPEINSATKTIKSVRHDWTFVKDLDDMKTWNTGSK